MPTIRRFFSAMRRGACVFSVGLLVMLPARAAAQQPASAAAQQPASAAAQQTDTTPSTADAPPGSGVQATPPAFDNPWARRPVCASLFLKSDWQLTKKQRACDWLHNRLFSTSAMVGAAWSAGVSQVRDAASERGDGFGTRFSRRLAQSAIKSTGAYFGGVIAREDPRMAPPYLVMNTSPRPRGFWRRTGHALTYNFVSYRCRNACQSPEDIDRQPALSRVLGAVASGYAAELWTWDRENSHQRAWRGAASAYGSTFVSALVSEFKPELSAFAARTFTAIFGMR